MQKAPRLHNRCGIGLNYANVGINHFGSRTVRNAAASTLLLFSFAGHVQAQSTFDGTYRPPSGGVYGQGPQCAGSFNSAIIVKAGVASMMTSQRGTFEGKIGADGSLAVQRGNVNLTGKFSSQGFDGTYGGNCKYTLHYPRE